MSDVLVPAAIDQTCGKCGRATMDGRKRGAKWWCHTCLAIDQMVYRKLGGLPEELTEEDKQAFFTQAAQQSTKGVQWHLVKACMEERMVHRREHESSLEVSATYKPLEVWLAAGYKEETVRKCPMEDNPILGETYAVPLKTMSSAERYKNVQETLLRREQEVVRKRGKKTDAEVPEKDWVLPTEAPSSSKGNQSGKEGKAKEKEELRDKNRVKKANAALVALATKCLATVSPKLESIKKFLLHPGAFDVQPLNEAVKTLGDWQSACRHCIHEGAKDKEEALTPLPFDKDSFKACVDAAAETLAAGRKTKKAEAQAKPKSRAKEATAPDAAEQPAKRFRVTSKKKE